jgi:putative PIN family toxin of toxin-antitoxin system
MLRAGVDTNVVVSGFISGFDNSAAYRVLACLRQGLFRLVTTDAALTELRFVLGLKEIQKRHGASNAMLDAFCDNLRSKGELFDPPTAATPLLARDITDAKFVDLALASGADYLVTRDRRHLLNLKMIGRTRIVTAHKFLLALRGNVK